MHRQFPSDRNGSVLVLKLQIVQDRLARWSSPLNGAAMLAHMSLPVSAGLLEVTGSPPMLAAMKVDALRCSI
jgi:hypothetical protein